MRYDLAVIGSGGGGFAAAIAARNKGRTVVMAVEQGYRCDRRVLPLEYVPRALVNRDTHGLIKLAAQAFTRDVATLSCCAS